MLNLLSQIKINKLFQPNYIFEATPAAEGLYLYLTILFGIFILIALAVVVIYRHPKYPIYQYLRSQLFNIFLLTGIIGLSIIFFRYQQIAYLGSRLMLLLLILMFFIWSGWLCLFCFIKLPKIIKEEQEKGKFEKYLPRRQAGLSHRQAGLPKKK